MATHDDDTQSLVSAAFARAVEVLEQHKDADIADTLAIPMSKFREEYGNAVSMLSDPDVRAWTARKFAEGERTSEEEISPVEFLETCLAKMNGGPPQIALESAQLVISALQDTMASRDWTPPGQRPS